MNEETEIWKEIQNFPNYEISSLGTIKGKIDGKIKKQRFDKRSGYMTIALTNINGKKSLYIHRIIASAFIENPANLPQVNHKDGNKLNNSISNLEWVTLHSNNIHAREFLKKNLGNPKNFTNEQIKEIFSLNRNGLFSSEIAKLFDVHPSIVSRILRGESYQYINNYERTN